MKMFLMSFVCFAAVACAAQPQWTKPGATDSQFQADKEDCIHQAKLPRGTHIEAGKAYVENTAVPDCLSAKGYAAEGDTP
jgi:hypothetical protein